ncbi:MAG: hypothetical protein EOL97_09840 [Spirochaetia bacterium]|nr:hypothetical protein [Spirochaetia bacterium]
MEETKNDYIQLEERKNIRQKLQEARILLKEEKIEKSGKNSFTKIAYFTLQDIEPAITRVCLKTRVTPIFNFGKEEATLALTDWDSDEMLVFTSPMVEQKDSKMNEIQILGSLQTYIRRYLYNICFALNESDDEEKQDSLAYHDVMAVKNRIEVLMTNLMKQGMDIKEVITKLEMPTIKDEKQYMGCLNACAIINNLEVNMRKLLK